MSDVETDTVEIIKFLEKDRKTFYGRYKRNAFIAILILLFLSIIVISTFHTIGTIFFLFFFLMITPIIILILLGMQYKKWRNSFKGLFIKHIIEKYYPQFVYEPKSTIKLKDFTDSLLYVDYPIRGYKLFLTEDMLGGSVDKTNVRLAEVHVEADDSDADERDSYVVFHGLFVISDFNKNFNGTTLVLTDAESKLGKLGRILQKFADTVRHLPGESVNLEAPEFEKEFRVFSTDQIEARYILTPSLMQRILNFKKKTGQDIRVSFLSSKLFIAIPTKKRFLEPPSFKKPITKDQIESLVQGYIAEFLFATSFVNELNLNSRIWTRE